MNSNIHSSLLRVWTSARSGPINFPLEMVWQAEQNVFKHHLTTLLSYGWLNKNDQQTQIGVISIHTGFDCAGINI
jgi:hypothetical protein